jgi:hypothetical protein
VSETILFKHSCGSTCNCKGIDIWCPKCKVGTLILNKEFHIVELTSINKKEKKYFNSGKRVGRKQGALEELEKLLGRLKIGGFIDKEHLWEMIENRIKELEKELLK